MPYLGILTPEEARKLGVPDSTWVITPAIRPKLKASKPALKDNPVDKRDQQDGKSEKEE